MTIAFSKNRPAIFLWLAISLVFSCVSCSSRTSPNKEMINLLSTIAATENDIRNSFASETKLKLYDSLLKVAVIYPDSATAQYGMANTLLELGQEEKAIASATTQLFKNIPVDAIINIKQGEPTFTITRLKQFDFNNVTPNTVDCFPAPKTAISGR